MKRFLSGCLVPAALAFSAHAATFAPTLLKLSAPPVVQYAFDGKDLSLPVTVSGTPANVTFLVSTNGLSQSIRKVRNGHLGWHYVNNIDTCLYISSTFQFEPGARIITWNGLDENRKPVPPGSYTYNMWAVDAATPRVLMAKQITFNPWGYRTIVTHDAAGNPLSRPVISITDRKRSDAPDPIVHTLSRWTVGSDPNDTQVLETTANLGWCDVGGIAFQPDNPKYYFHDTLKVEGVKITRKWEWVPNGASVLQTSWGKNGEFSYTGPWTKGWNFGPGVVSDGRDYLFLTTGDMGNATKSEMIYLDVRTGAEIKRLDLTSWWIRPDDGKRGGQTSGGPMELFLRRGLLGLGSHSSCLNQLLDPYATNPEDAVLWSNGNGDYIGDKNFNPVSDRPWVCHDYNMGPYKYNISIDDNLFTAFPCFDLGAVSFGLYGPDGTGMGYWALAGETSAQKYGVEFIDYGSPYDGLYTSNNVNKTLDTGFWFVGHDSVKGTILSSGSYIFLVSPNGGEIWGTGTPHSILWQSAGVDKVRIEYSADGGSTWKSIAENVSAASGSYSWSPDAVNSEKCLVRVASIADASLKSVSRAVFTVTPPFVKVSSPNGSEVWETGTAHSIAWSSLGVESVKIEFSADDGSTWTVAAAGVDAAKGSYAWTLPGSPSDRCRVRVSDAAKASVSDVSDAVFQIKASFIRVVAPNGGEEWEARSDHTITWEASSVLKTVQIEISFSNGESWSPLVFSTAASTGSWLWRVPNLPSTKCLVRISDTGSSGLTDTSNGTFTIIPSTSPWMVYTTTDGLADNYIWSVTADPRGGIWAATGNGASYFNGVSWNTYTSANSGLPSNNIYDVAVDKDNVIWFVPTFASVTSFDGKIWKKHDSGPSSGRYMVVDQKNVKWIGTFQEGVARYDGTTWKYYDPTNSGVRSSACQVPAVDLDNTIWFAYGYTWGISHFDGSTWTNYTTTDGLANNLTHGVTVGPDGVKWFGSEGGVTRFDGKTMKNYTTADGLVSNFVECVAVDRNNVLWVGTGGGVSSFDGVEWKRWNTSNSPLPNNHIYKIAVDNDNVKWFATGGGGVANLTTYSGPYVQVASPNGGEIWESGSIREITWLVKDVARIKIEYSPDGGSTWSVIAGDADAAAKTFRWTLPQAQSSTCKVRLTDVSDAKYTDTSNGAFTISPPFVRLTSPNGGERWASGTTHQIVWTSVGVERVKLEYSSDGGANWFVINTVNAFLGSYGWTIPGLESAKCLVRITDPAAAERTDTGDAPFSILKPFITINVPNGGEAWTAGKECRIEWTSDGVNSVMIEFSVDGGLSWNRFAKTVSAAPGVYSWYPITVESRLCLVRLTDTEKPIVSDTSDKVFSVRVILSATEDIPKEFSVFSNHPNPFNPSTTIPFSLPRAETVRVDIFNWSGQRVGCAYDGRMERGRRTVVWNAGNLSAGLYFARVRAGTEAKTVKMLLLK